MHPMKAIVFVKLDVEVSYQEIREVIACHFKQQLVFIHGVGLIGEDKPEFVVALDIECLCHCRVL